MARILNDILFVIILFYLFILSIILFIILAIYYLGNYGKKTVRIWKRYIPLLIDLLISNNFSSMTFFGATRILRVIGSQSIVHNHS